MVHIQTLCFVLLFTTVSCRSIPSSSVEELLDLLYNKLGAIQNCSKTHVLLSNINYFLYTQENRRNGIMLDSTNLNAVNPKHRVVFIIHGWFQGATDRWVIDMKDAHLNLGPANVILVDYSYYSHEKPGLTYCAVPQIGKLTGELIYNLTVTVKIDLNSTQINGFSLGGQISGFAGQEVQVRTGGAKIGRINGMDAEGPGFLDLPLDQRLDASDAWFVQGIHTSNWQIGYTHPYGTVDFQVNFKLVPGCGAIQPGCPLVTGIPTHGTVQHRDFLNNIMCNHVRGPAYFLESITSDNFIGVACGSCFDFGVGFCKFQPTAIMGENCPSTARGVFYLNTNADRPFAKGLAGITGKFV